MVDRFLKFYDDKFFKEHEPWRREYKVVSKWILDNIAGKTFGDIGCGNGYMVSDLNRFGKKVWGVDGSDDFMKFVEPNVKKFVSQVDLTEPQRLKLSDVTLCFEVAEHIEKKFDDTFIDNIVSTKAKTILFTAAHPGQGGTNHVNLQPSSYWINKFNKRGYILDPISSEKFKVDLGERVEVVEWYLDNIMIFKHSNNEITVIYDQAEKLLRSLNSKVQQLQNETGSLDKELDKKNQQIINRDRDLEAIQNSKRWKLASGVAKFIRRS